MEQISTKSFNRNTKSILDRLFVLLLENQEDRKVHEILSSRCGNKKMQCYD